MLYSPSIDGGHSLDSWGERMGEPKIKFNDWSSVSDEMVEYCHQDVLITAKLFVRLIKILERIGFSERSIWIQHRLTAIIDRQHRNGFYFDGQRALELYQNLRTREEDLADEIRKVFPPKRIQVATRLAFKRDGSHSSIYERDLDRYDVELTEDGHYIAYDSLEFNIGSPKQRIERLLELGWEPQEFTEKTEKGGGGNPRPFIHGKMSPSLELFLENNDVPEVQLIAKWMAFNGRANMINTWLENWNENDNCIHGKLFIADTLRFRHQAPNTANIPAVRVKETKDIDGSVLKKRVLRGEEGFFTYEARDLWTARPGRVLVGTDAAGLELRMLAHYLNRPDFTKQVVEGDPHQYNADLVGITRPQAKTLIYAIMYGAAAPKIAATLNVPVREGAKIRMMFLEKLGLKELIEECQDEQRNGRVSLVDGSQVVCPSPHAALNYKLQGGGARVMGLGSVLLERFIVRDGLDSLKVGDIHDEWQYDVACDDASHHGERSIEAIRNAGEVLSLNVPLDGEAKAGQTWAETH
jgi:DNA polymerase-1